MPLERHCGEQDLHGCRLSSPTQRSHYSVTIARSLTVEQWVLQECCAQRTLATRRRMVKAAYELFCTHGYIGTTMAAVASRAGVAAPTVYYTFATKAALLDEALGAAIVGFDRWREPPGLTEGMAEILPWHSWWNTLLAAPTSAEALTVFVTNGCGILARVAPLMAAMHGRRRRPRSSRVRRAERQEPRRRVRRHPEGRRRQAARTTRRNPPRPGNRYRQRPVQPGGLPSILCPRLDATPLQRLFRLCSLCPTAASSLPL